MPSETWSQVVLHSFRIIYRVWFGGIHTWNCVDDQPIKCNGFGTTNKPFFSLASALIRDRSPKEHYLMFDDFSFLAKRFEIGVKLKSNCCFKNWLNNMEIAMLLINSQISRTFFCAQWMTIFSAFLLDFE